MSAPKYAIRFHYQHAIYLSRPQSLAMVPGVFKLNYQVKRDKGGNGKERKKKANVLPSHLSLRTLKKVKTMPTRYSFSSQTGQSALILSKGSGGLSVVV